MAKSRTLVNLLTLIVIAGAGLLAYQLWRGQSTQDETTDESFESTAIPAAAPAPITPAPSAAAVSPNAGIAAVGPKLEEIAQRWEQANAASQGDKLRALSQEVANKIGPGPELLAWLNFLAAHGAVAEREWLLTEGLDSRFSGPAAKETRAWLLTVGDVKVKERICYPAGEMFTGPDFNEYFEAMGVAAGLNCQSALLTGYCITMAKTDPEAAIRTYKELAYPKRIDNTGMAQVMAVFPANSNFLSFATAIKEDSMTLAKRARAALLVQWTKANPVDAAAYVIGNPTQVHPDQMAVVVRQWAKTSPDAAAEWLAQAIASPARDQGMAELTRYWKTRNPKKAWDFVKQLGDPQFQQATAAGVVFEWMKSDPNAAKGAWSSLSRVN